jgi:hypothetical protein
MNGMDVWNGHLPRYADHPGVPLTLVAAAALPVIYILSPHQESMHEAVLLHPLYYELALKRLLFTLILLASFLAGFMVLKISNSLSLSILIQASPFFFPFSLYISTNSFMPDGLLILVYYLLSIVLLPVIINENKLNEEKFPLWVGLIGGLGLSIKLTFLPLLFIPAMIMSNNIRKIRKYVVFTILGFLLFTLPVFKSYPHMFKWFSGLFIHSGTYGQGAANVINFAQYFQNLKFILFEFKIFTLALIFSTLSLPFIYLRSKKDLHIRKLFRWVWILYLTQWLSIFIVAKPFQHKEYYLITTYFIISIQLVFTLACLLYKTNETSMICLTQTRIKIHHASSIRSIKNKLFSDEKIKLTFALLLIFGSIYPNWNYYDDIAKSIQATRNEQGELEYFIQNKTKENALFVTLNAFSFSKMQGLMFGNCFSSSHKQKLKELYPEAYFFNVVPAKFSHWLDEVPFDNKSSERPVYLIDVRADDGSIAYLKEAGYEAELVFENRTKAVYELTTVEQK